MNRTRTILTSLALAAPLVLGATLASAQSYPRASQAQPQNRRQDVARARPQLVTRLGVVRHFLFTGARVSGVVLTNGSTVLVRRADRASLRTVARGSFVRARGFVMPGDETTIRDATLSALRRGFRAPNAPQVRAPLPAPTVAITGPVTAHGTIRAVHYGDNGPLTLTLRGGRTVIVPPAMERSLVVHEVAPGQHIFVTAHVAGANPSTALVAETMRFSNGVTIHSDGRRQR